MNKSIFLFLLALLILNTNCESCSAKTTGCDEADKVKGYDCVLNEAGDHCVQKSKCEQKTENCGTIEVPSGYKCELKDKKCTLVSTATNSSNSLNIFKITFTLLIIFTIL